MTSKNIAVMLALLAGAAAAGFDRGGSDGGANVSIQSIRGIEGIDAVALENLEAVIRIQSRAPTAAARTAAALSTMHSTELGEDDGLPDAREQLNADLEGS